MNSRTRGAATVSVVWVIVLIVLVMATGAGLYLLASERAKQESDVADAQAKEKAATSALVEKGTRLLLLSKPVGFRNEKDPLAESDPMLVEGILKQLQENYSAHGIGPDADSLSRVVERMRTRLDDLTRELNEAKQQASASEQGRLSLQQNLQDVTRQKDEANAEIEKRLSDERDRNASVEAADKTRIDELNKRVTDQEARARSEKEELEKTLADAQGEIRKRDGRIVELAKKVEYLRLPDAPDGSIVAVSNANTCYVDLGSRQLLRRGTRFKVFTYAKNGAMREKGMIEVAKVEEAMAEATVVELKDRFDPIARGDRIAAPNYDPEMPREFVLTGRFPTGYSRAMVADRLRALGATVVEKVGPATDFLVMGDKDAAAAPAEGDASAAADGGGEEAAESEDVKLATLYRVQILPVREILEFLKYE